MNIIREAIKIFIFIDLQIFLLKDLVLFNCAMSFLYIVYFILLTMNIGRAYLMLLGFLLGVLVDVFYNTGGIHAFSTVMIAYLRPFIAKRFLKSSYNKKKNEFVTLNATKWVEVVTYSVVIIFIHHALVLFIEVSSFHLFFYTLAKVICSTIFTSFLFLTGYYLFQRSN